MTKKDYIKFAKMLNQNKGIYHWKTDPSDVFVSIYNDIIKIFKNDSPLFDVKKFEEAVND